VNKIRVIRGGFLVPVYPVLAKRSFNASAPLTSSFFFVLESRLILISVR
jgi:hypothetical protein